MQSTYLLTGAATVVEAVSLLAFLGLSIVAALRQGPAKRAGWAVLWVLCAGAAAVACLALLSRSPFIEIMGGPSPVDAFERLAGILLLEAAVALLTALGFGISSVVPWFQRATS